MTKSWLLLLVVVSSSVFGQAPGAIADAAQANKPRPNTITGRVLGEDGQPLIGAFVSAFKIGSNSSTGTVTDAEGKFIINNLAPGAYQVAASLSLYVTSTNANTNPYFVGDHVTLTLVKGGVITGRVLNTHNEPVVGAAVSAQRIRNAEGEAVPAGTRSAMTDDRGVYRIFGLWAGAYFVVVRTGAELSPNSFMLTETPTYFPSSTRDTAQEIVVGAGAEVAGIDIHFRGESGYAVSGTISGLTETSADANIYVSISVSSPGANGSGNLPNAQVRGNRFAIYGVPDGEYEIRAYRSPFPSAANEPRVFSTPLKVRVRGGDVTGLELKLMPAPMITGRVTLEKYAGDKSSCVINRVGRLDEIVVRAAPFDSEQRGLLSGAPVVPEVNGDFTLRDLSAGRFRLVTQLPSDFWYLKRIQLKSPSANLPSARASAPTSKTIDVGQQGVHLAAGEKLAGVTINIAEGAASLDGKVVTDADTNLPARLRVHLFSVDAASDALRYAAASVRSDATFSFRHLAPGKYWLVVCPPIEGENRADLQRAAEAANQVIELTPCQCLSSSIQYRTQKESDK